MAKEKAAEPKTVTHAAFLLGARPYASACFQSIAVTFGTATSSSKDAGFTNLETRRSLVLINTLLTAQAQTIHHLVVAFNIRALEIIQQTPSLRDHF